MNEILRGVANPAWVGRGGIGNKNKIKNWENRPTNAAKMGDFLKKIAFMYPPGGRIHRRCKLRAGRRRWATIREEQDFALKFIITSNSCFNVLILTTLPAMAFASIKVVKPVFLCLSLLCKEFLLFSNNCSRYTRRH